MKKRIISALLILLLLLPIMVMFTGCATEVEEGYITPTNNEPDYQFSANAPTFVREDKDKDTIFTLIEENDKYEFYFSSEILEIALKSKETGEIWYSNPAPSDRNIGIKSEMSSQVSLFYLNKKDGSQSTLESYLDCILNNNEELGIEQYHVVNHNGNLRVIYVLGQIKPDYIIPTCIEGSVAEQYAAAMKADPKHSSQARAITTGSVYAKITPNVWSTYTTDIQNEYLQIAPNMGQFIAEGKTVYIIKDQTKLYNAERMQKLQAAFVEVIGMDLEARDKINEEFGVEIEPAKTFWIPVDYELTSGGLSVTIPNEEIKYDTNTFAIASINLLQYFGSASKSEEGYMFVPDGSGAIINFNNGKTNISKDIRVQLYGLDDGRELLTRPYRNEQAYLPVFGIKKANSALFGIIESGDTNATIVADIAGKNVTAVDRNRCYTSFKMSEYEEIQFKSAGKVSRIYQNEMNSADLSITYSILDGEKANYSGMAEYYRNYLIDKGVLSKKNFKDIPFNIELVGAYDHKTAFLGVGYTEMKAITTFDQCQELIKKLADKGVKNISINYKGWANNGLRNSVFNKAHVLDALGGKNGLTNLLNYAEGLGVNVFFETELALVYKTELFGGYNTLTQASRLVTRDIAYHYQYIDNWNTASPDNKATIAAPSNIYNIDSEDNSRSFLTGLVNDINNLNIKAVSLGSLANNLPGNYKVDDFYDRDKTAKTYAAVAKKFSEDKIVMGKSANNYMLAYVDEIFEISNISSKFNLADQSVPFYQMVIHGCIEYSGEPINLNGDTRRTFLQAVEAGSGLYYRWCYAPNTEVQDLWFEGMYSLNYEAWLDEAIAMYNEYNNMLSDTADAFLVNHEAVAENVNKITYSNGVEVYINYNSYDYTAADGTLVKAESFAKGGNN